jgi:hypothetical protein
MDVVDDQGRRRRLVEQPLDAAEGVGAVLLDPGGVEGGVASSAIVPVDPRSCSRSLSRTPSPDTSARS